MPLTTPSPAPPSADRPARRGSTVRRQLLALVLVTLIPFLAMFALRARERSANERAAAAQRARELAHLVAEGVDSHVSRIQMLMTATSRAIGTSAGDAPRNDSLLLGILDELGDSVVSFLWVAAPDGRIIGTSMRPLPEPGSADVGGREYFQEALRTRRPTVGRAIQGQLQGNWIVVLTHPILDADGQITAVMLASMRLVSLTQLASRTRLPGGTVVTVVDSAGTVLGRNEDAPSWVGKKVPNHLSTAEIIASGGGPEEVTGLDGVRRVSGFANTTLVPWRVFVGIPRDLAFAPATRAFRRDLTMAGITAILALLLSLAVARRLTRPLDALTANALSIAAGDHQPRQRVVSSIRELTTLAESFDSMAATVAARNEQLRRAQKTEALGRFAGGIAHDFNNLLTAILGYCDLALDDIPSDAPARLDVAAIRSTAQRAANLTRQILAFSRRQMLQPVLLDLNGVVGGMEAILGRLMEHGVAVRLALSPRSGTVLADRSQLEQVILNLVLNARDAMPGGGTVLVETGELVVEPASTAGHPHADGPGPGSWLFLAVHDTGVGMTQAMKAQILEPFFTTKERSKGTGLGLATVDGIVQQSGGVLHVESTPGVGSTFRVFLPRATGSAAPVTPGAEPPSVPPPSGGTARTILLAEDEDAVRAVAAAALGRAGYRVIAARSGGEAIGIAASHGAPVDLLVTDVVMPGMMGPELATRLGRTQPGLRVLLTSGYTDDDRLLRELASESLPFIAKPFTPDQLVARVRSLLEGEPAPAPTPVPAPGHAVPAPPRPADEKATLPRSGA